MLRRQILYTKYIFLYLELNWKRDELRKLLEKYTLYLEFQKTIQI